MEYAFFLSPLLVSNPKKNMSGIIPIQFIGGYILDPGNWNYFQLKLMCLWLTTTTFFRNVYRNRAKQLLSVLLALAEERSNVSVHFPT